MKILNFSIIVCTIIVFIFSCNQIKLFPTYPEKVTTVKGKVKILDSTRLENIWGVVSSSYSEIIKDSFQVKSDSTFYIEFTNVFSIAYTVKFIYRTKITKISLTTLLARYKALSCNIESVGQNLINCESCELKYGQINELGNFNLKNNNPEKITTLKGKVKILNATKLENLWGTVREFYNRSILDSFQIKSDSTFNHQFTRPLAGYTLQFFVKSKNDQSLASSIGLSSSTPGNILYGVLNDYGVVEIKN